MNEQQKKILHANPTEIQKADCVDSVNQIKNNETAYDFLPKISGSKGGGDRDTLKKSELGPLASTDPGVFAENVGQDKISSHSVETPKQDVHVIVTKNKTTNRYNICQPMTYDFYLLYLLCTETLTTTSTDSKKNSGFEFYKNSSIPCLVTPQLFINKNKGYIELFSIYDLTNNSDDLCLPKSPKFIMTAKNFMNFMVQKAQLHQQQPDQFFLVIDSQGHAHLTTDLQSLVKVSFFTSLQKKLASLFT